MNTIRTNSRLCPMALVCLLAAVASCTRSKGNTESPSFREFLTATERAQPNNYRGKPGVRVIDDAAFEKMKAYLIDRYRGVHVSHSFVGTEHGYVDCVPILEQPSIKNRQGSERTIDRKPPPVPEGPHPVEPERQQDAFRAPQSLDIRLKPGLLDPVGNERFCHDDTIPIRRITLEELTRFPTLEAFFRKGERGDNRQVPGDDQHYYARGVQFVSNLGADTWLNVWSPSVAADQMSLSQLWVVAGDGGSKQTAEAGWQVMPDKWGSNSAALFIYYTTGGYQDGTGCYNVDCDGFRQVANNVYLGSGFDHYSAPGQTQWGFELQYKRDTDGNWWLFYRGGGDWIAVGYYPKSLYGTGGLATQSAKIAFGGEDTGNTSAKQMGSGEKSDAHFGKAAYQNTIFYIDSNGTSQWASLSSEEPNPTCYTADINNIFGAWGTYLYFGGPSCN